MDITKQISYILETARKRILYFIDNQSIKTKEFLEKTRLKKGVIDKSHEKSGISDLFLSKILDAYPEINPFWLLTGKGDMLLGDSPKKATTTSGKGIPLVDAYAVGGFGGSHFTIEERDIKDHYIIPKFKHLNVDFMIEVRGDSMSPRYSGGDVVACRVIKESKVIQWNKVYVVATNENGILIKRLKKSSTDGCVSAVSDNKDYEPFDLPQDEITGIALVVGGICID